MRLLLVALVLPVAVFGQTQNFTTQSYYPGHLQVTPQGGTPTNYTIRSYYPGHMEVTPQGGISENYAVRSYYPGHIQFTPNHGTGNSLDYSVRSYYPGHTEVTPLNQPWNSSSYISTTPRFRSTTVNPVFESRIAEHSLDLPPSSPIRPQTNSIPVYEPRVSYELIQQRKLEQEQYLRLLRLKQSQVNQDENPEIARQNSILIKEIKTVLPSKPETPLRPTGQITPLYSESGYAVAFFDDVKALYNWDGIPAAVLLKSTEVEFDYLFGINGKLIGFGYNGMILDDKGEIIFATERLFKASQLQKPGDPRGRADWVHLLKGPDPGLPLPRKITVKGWSKETMPEQFLQRGL